MNPTQTNTKPLVQLQRKAAAGNELANNTVAKPEAWSLTAVAALFSLPLNQLMWRAQETHRAYFPDGDIELATLVSIKTGGCPEDCGYCPQAARYHTGVEATKLMTLEAVLAAAQAAKAAGSNRFCMGAAWREPKDRDIEKVVAMIRGVKAMGLETCATLGMLEPEQAKTLSAAGLDFYNHNLDTSEDFYSEVIQTRVYQDRLDTIDHVRAAGMSVCCGGIVGMGESRAQRVAFLTRLANLNPYPESVPINHLVPVIGTPLEAQKPLDPLEFVRTIAVARITMPSARVRLSAGRQELGRAVQAMCFQAGANSIFYGEQLLTTSNPEAEYDRALLADLGLKVKETYKVEVEI
ncbi:biotin synthase BioB [Polynucleobacter sp. IMCC30063]|uniref:biotin synthase BioB n=1 Tax=Polynucleobacter sp. IMCC30063 TaxID=2907298 RepID=UPI001F24AE7A|nr:biotin synthase BioB [Polynucleobacter sp. IMCC30063]MCE7505035.1 biotin synthase BioB [Polynucleobacter sp. IMCC30063]